MTEAIAPSIGSLTRLFKILDALHNAPEVRVAAWKVIHEAQQGGTFVPLRTYAAERDMKYENRGMTREENANE